MKRCKLSYCLLAVMMLLALLLPQGITQYTSAVEAKATVPLSQPAIGSTGHVGALTGETGAHDQASIPRPGGVEASGPLYFASHVITTTADYARSVYAADIDDDGDMDLLSASRDDATITWYENDGGEHPTFASHVISTGAVGATSVYADDMDGDGDMDLLSASAWDDKIAWYENNGASDPLFASHVVTTTADLARWVHAADIDGDDDIDILSASRNDDKVAWYENDGASSPAFTGHIITTWADGATSVYAADLDDDNDLDVLSGSYLDDMILWYENDGGSPPTFTNRTLAVTAQALWVLAVHAADMDADGDVDVLSASDGDDQIAWYENDGGSPPTFASHVITANADRATSVYAADVDGDGDMDAVSSSYGDDRIVWYENNGDPQPTFTGHVITSAAHGAEAAYAADVDGDGDMDVLSASADDDKIAWYENSDEWYVVHLPVIFSGFGDTFLDKIYTTPDYLQIDPAYGGLPGEGRTYCGPTAVSNSLMWLDDNGYDSIASSTSDRKRDQFDLIYLLGSAAYMNTSLANGTGVNGVLNGVDRYIHDCGYQYARLQYQGWRYHDPEFGTGVEVPNLPWIKQGIRGYSSAWLNLGWYSYDGGTDQYTRTGGHWVTLVGYGHDSSLATPTYLIIHDPAWGDGSSITNLYLFLERIDSGTLAGNYTGLPRSAVGYYKATRTLYPQADSTALDSAPEAADFGILDGVVVLEMPETPASVDMTPESSRPAPLLVNEGD